MTENYTPEQEIAITELRNRMKSELPSEVYDDKILLYKFLKARNFNLKQAESMLRKNLRFRKEIQADSIIKDFKPSEVLSKYISHEIIGFDKKGCPCRYIALGNTDGIGLFQSANSHDILMCSLQAMEIEREIHKQQSKKLGRLVTHSVYIYDMDKLTFTQATHKQSLHLFMKELAVFQDNFPELLKSIYIINASIYFTFAWSLVKSVLASAILQKIHVYGRDGWKEELIRHIDADVLPAFLGGNRTDPDGNPLCLTFVNHGGMVPKSYYLEKDIEKIARKPGIKHVRLERQASVSIPLDIRAPKTIINWEFETKHFDVGFGLMMETLNGEITEELIPIHKLQTELEPLTGMYRCKKAGIYTLVFDNSYSWLHHKDIYYRTWMTDANGVKID